jgi:hypothetical protein
VPAVQLGWTLLGKLKIWPPDQRSVGKNPEVILTAPLVQKIRQHLIRVARGFKLGIFGIFHDLTLT